MRVLHVIPSVASRYGGPSAAIGPMCRALIDAGVDVHLASTDADGPGHLAVPLEVDTTWDEVPARFFRNDATEAFKYSRGMAAWLRRHVRDFDLVHVHAVLSHAPIAAAAACRRAGVPYVVRPLGTIASWSLGRKAWRKRVLLALAARRMLHGAAAIHCTSAEEREDAARTFGLTQGVVIPLGLDPALAQVPAGTREARRADPYVLALSRLHPKKNLELLIDAFLDARAADAASRWRLVIAGSGDEAYTTRLRQVVAARHAQADVTFAGWVERDAKRVLLQGASLFALPSQHENFGVAVLESLACGVPAVISLEVQLAPALLDAGAGWVVDSTREALTGALTEAMQTEARREEKGQRATAMAARFAWPAIARQMVALYDGLVPHAQPTQEG